LDYYTLYTNVHINESIIFHTHTHENIKQLITVHTNPANKQIYKYEQKYMTTGCQKCHMVV